MACTATAATHWHAHLSAIPKPVVSCGPPQQPAVPQPQQQSQPRALLGTSLDRGILGVDVRLRSMAAEVFLARAKGRAVDAEEQPDSWVIRPVRDAPGEYNVMLNDQFLSVPAEGREVDLWHEDDGSGRQRWVFRQVGDTKYIIRVAGGKRDDRVYLGIRDDASVRLFAEDKGEQTEWNVSLVDNTEDTEETGDDKNVRCQVATTATAGGTTQHLPGEVVPELRKLTGLTEKHVDVILQLISLPENSTPQWWTNYNYIEFLGDGRGFTVTLYGACSGTGDLAMIFDELAKIRPRSAACDELLKYTDVLKKKRGDDIKGIEPIKKIIKGLGDDTAWQQAVWKVYVKLYWRFAMEWADKTGQGAKRPGPPLTMPLTRGFMVDTAINHGADFESFMEIVKRMPEASKTTKDELAWFRAFADAREKMLKSGYQHLDTSKTGDRCRLWKDLAAQGNTQLQAPFKAYKGYWGSYTVN